MAAPAIGYAAHLLVHLALKVPRPANAVEAAALAIRIVAVVRLRQFPLHAFECERGLDRLLTIGRPDRGSRVELDVVVGARGAGFAEVRDGRTSMTDTLPSGLKPTPTTSTPSGLVRRK